MYSIKFGKKWIFFSTSNESKILIQNCLYKKVKYSNLVTIFRLIEAQVIAISEFPLDYTELKFLKI
jgi:hypothetical protein